MSQRLEQCRKNRGGLEVAKMSCLRSIKWKTTRERMRFEDLRKDVKVVELREKIRKGMMWPRKRNGRKWICQMVSWAQRTRKRGWPRKLLINCIRDDGKMISQLRRQEWLPQYYTCWLKCSLLYHLKFSYDVWEDL